MKIFELKFFDGTSLLSFGGSMDGILWIDSDYFSKTPILEQRTSVPKRLAFNFYSNPSTESYSFEIFEEKVKFQRIVFKYHITLYNFGAIKNL